MAHNSSLNIPSSEYFLKVYRCLTYMFGGDLCCSSIVSILDFLTVGKMDALQAAGDTEGILWVQINLERMHQDMCGMYSIRRIQDRIAFLVVNGILVMPSHQEPWGHDHSTTLSFALNRDAIHEFWKQGVYVNYEAVTRETLQATVNHPNSIENASDICRRIVANFTTCVRLASHANYLSLETEEKTFKVEEQEQEQETPYTPPIGAKVKTEHTDLGDSQTSAAPPVGRKLLGRSGFPKKERRKGMAGSDKVRILREDTGQGAAGCPTPEVSGANQPPIEPEASQPSPKEFIRRWNKAIPERKIEFHTAYNFKLTLDDPEFAAKFDQILAKAREMYDAEEDPSWWLTFDYLLKSKDGMENWQSLLRRKPKPKNGKHQSTDELIRRAMET